MINIVENFSEVKEFYKKHYEAEAHLHPQEPANAKFLGMKNGGEFVAMVEVDQVYNQHLCFIWKFVVTKELRRQGTGTLFYSLFEKWLEERGTKKIIAYVYFSNLASVFFCLKNGFLVEGLMRDNDEKGSKVYTLGKSLY